MRLLLGGVDDGHVGDGAFIGFQTLDKRLRAFFIRAYAKATLRVAGPLKRR
jgi:hypothetical protein